MHPIITSWLSPYGRFNMFSANGEEWLVVVFGWDRSLDIRFHVLLFTIQLNCLIRQR